MSSGPFRYSELTIHAGKIGICDKEIYLFFDYISLALTVLKG